MPPRKRSNQDNDDNGLDISQIDKIVGVKEGKDPTYQVLMKDKKSKRPQKVKESILKKSAHGKKLIAAFNKANARGNVNDQPKSNQDRIIDRILSKSDGKYVVKWVNEPYSKYTLESEVDLESLKLFEHRQKLKYPSKNGAIKKCKQLPKFTELEFNGVTISPYQQSIINYFIRMYNTQDSCDFVSKRGISDPFLFGVFINYIMDQKKEQGPYLFIIDNEMIEYYYKELSRFKDFVTISYSGIQENRSTVESIAMFNGEKLMYHVLITTPELYNKISIIKGMNYSMVIYCYTEKQCLSFNTKFCIKNKVETFSTFIPDAHDLVDTVMRLDESLEYKDEISAIFKSMRIYFPYNDSPVQHESSKSVTRYIIDCPMSLTQKEAAMFEVSSRRSDITDGSFGMLSEALRRTVQHPFLNRAFELRSQSDLIKASTKMQILQSIIEQSLADDQKIAILSKYDEIFDICEDAFPNLSFVRNGYGANVLLNTRRSRYMDFLEGITTVIEFDGEESFLEYGNNNVSTAYRLLCNGALESAWSNYSDDEICRMIVIHAFTVCKENDIEMLLSEPITDLATEPLFEVTGDNFWTDFSDLEYAPQPIDAGDRLDNRQRNQLVRGVFAVGWDRWNSLQKKVSRRMEDDKLKKAAGCVVRRALELSHDPSAFPVAADLVSGMPVDEPIPFDDPEPLIKGSAGDLLRQLELLQYFHAATDDHSEINYSALKNAPEQWWEEKYDIALLNGVSNYGIGCYDDFAFSGNSDAQKIFKEAKDYGSLTNRTVELLTAIKSNLGESNLIAEFLISDEVKAKWKKSDAIYVIAHVMDKGIAVNNETGNNDFADLKDKLSDVIKDKNPEDFEELINDITADKTKRGKREEFNNAASSIIDIIMAMNELHFIVKEGKEAIEKYITKYAKWKSMPKSWTPAIECQFLMEIFEKGLSSASAFIARPEISALFGKSVPGCVTKASGICSRIHHLSQSIRRGKPSADTPAEGADSAAQQKKKRPRAKQQPPQISLSPSTVPQQSHSTVPSPVIPSASSISSKIVKLGSSSHSIQASASDESMLEDNKATNKRIIKLKKNSSASTSASPLMSESPSNDLQIEAPVEEEKPVDEKDEVHEDKEREKENEKEKESESDQESHEEEKKKRRVVRKKSKDDEFKEEEKAKTERGHRQPRAPVSINDVTFPLEITQTTKLYSLGQIITDRDGFHSNRYVYPAGFKTSRLGKSTKEPNKMVVYYSEILDNNEDVPLFRVTSEDGIVFEGQTPTAPWSQILKESAKINSLGGRALSVSGPEMYLFSHRIVHSLINQMEGIDKLKVYKPKEVKPRNSNSGRKKKANTEPEAEKKAAEENEKEKEKEKAPEKEQEQEPQEPEHPPANSKSAKKQKRRKKIVASSESSSSSESKSDSNDEDFAE